MKTIEKYAAYEKWKKDLPNEASCGTRGFYFREEDHGVLYRDSMGNSHWYDMEQLPEMVKCYIYGFSVWKNECTTFRNLKNEIVFMSKMASNSHKLVNAYSERGDYQRYLKRDTVLVEGNWYTKSCIGKSIMICPKTNDLCITDAMVTFNGEKVSRTYYDKLRAELVIQQHDWRPESFVIPEGTEYAGIELEVEAMGGNWEQQYLESAYHLEEKYGDFLYMKRDGSLTNGYEIVTQPITWETITNRLAPAVAEIQAMGIRSYESGNCGLHVHLPKAHLSKLEIAKYAVLWNSDHEWITRIAGRSGTESSGRRGQNYCRLRRGMKPMFNGGPSCVDHYSAINTTNEHTIEVRSFRGTLNVPTFLARIGMCFLVRSYLKQCDIKPSWEGFLHWIIRHPHERRKFKEAWSMITILTAKHMTFSPALREEVAAVAAKKSQSPKAHSSPSQTSFPEQGMGEMML